MEARALAIELGLAGKIALVTGSGAGIGRGIAGWLARAGCRVAVNDIDAVRAEASAAEILASGGQAKAFVADVRDEAAVLDLVAQVRWEFGGLDVAVNNVGMNAGLPATPFTEWKGADFRAVVEQNLMATALCCLAEARAMVEQGRGGVILNVTSGETTRPAIRLAPYGAAKAAINHLTQTMAVELGPQAIRVNAIAPGTTLTEQVRKTFPESHVAAILESIPLRRMTEPEELGRLAVYLASDLARCVTGQFLLADAGAFLSRSRPTMPPAGPSR